MNDTSPAAAAKMRELIQQKTPVERLLMGCSMFDFSKQLAAQSILASFPGITRAQFRRELFLRFYGEDFDLAQKERIIEHLDRLP